MGCECRNKQLAASVILATATNRSDLRPKVTINTNMILVVVTSTRPTPLFGPVGIDMCTQVTTVITKIATVMPTMGLFGQYRSKQYNK